MTQTFTIACASAALSGLGLAVDGLMLEAGEGLRRLAAAPHLLCHAHFVTARLGAAARATRGAVRAAAEQKHFDVAELFAFVCPAQLAIPSPAGLARALALDPAATDDDTLRAVAAELLQRLASRHYPHLRETAEAATYLAHANWPWAEPVLKALRHGHPRLEVPRFATGLNVWDRLEDWEDEGPRPPPTQEAVSPDEARAELMQALGPHAEARPAQRDYAAAAAHAFQPRDNRAFNHILLAEAGTGLGKTLGYLAPAHLYARRNRGPVWISTYTKNLQRQLDQESHRLIDDPALRRRQIVIRKGRENYACLLNMQEAFGRLSGGRGAALATLIARWARATRDGDMVGGDFPSWLFALFGEGEGAPSPASLGLTDRRGECIYVACPHYRKCFIEKSQRAARNAALVIANHALVLHQAAMDHLLGAAQTEEEEAAPGGLRRIVFDEGHHLFDAADSAFASHLTALETSELRRWLRGPEDSRRRGRGLAERLGDLAAQDDEMERLTQQALRAALALPGPGWTRRVQAGSPEGAAEEFLALVRQQVLARADSQEGVGALETDCLPLVDGLAEQAVELAEALADLKRPLVALAKRLAAKLDSEAEDLTSAERGRIEALSRSLRRRGDLMLSGWITMLDHLPEAGGGLHVDWFAIEQAFGREADVGLYSHWLDPTEPLALSVLRPADGIIITSATLKDQPPDVPDDWESAELRTGVVHLPWPVKRAGFASPFDYPARAQVIVVNDVNRADMDQVAAAYRELFLATGGGALGLFTAIARLRAVHKRLLTPLAAAGLTLYAQHADPMDTATLVDMFRAEPDACLLGTDAVRDGVDVPGRSLRLMVLDRVPWPTPTILERARREAFGGQAHTDMVVRLRLRQGFGRLIRQASDHGSFVVLDPRLASRFATAFPPGLAIQRMGLADAIDAVRAFDARFTA